MKRTSIFLTAFLFSIMNMFAQVDSVNTNEFQVQPVQPAREVQVFLYPQKELVRDTLTAVEFTYIHGKILRYEKGQLVSVSELWTTDPNGDQVVLKKNLEFYIISDNGLRYEIKNRYVGNTLCNSFITKHKGFFKWFKRTPPMVYDIKTL